jgi:hypothetical protein
LIIFARTDAKDLVNVLLVVTLAAIPVPEYMNSRTTHAAMASPMEMEWPYTTR